ACRTLGYSFDELTGMTLADIDPELVLDNHNELWEQAKRKKLNPQERTHRKKDGTIFPVEINAMHSDYDGHEYATAIVRDISERKAIARREE
ncbi:MAG: PAS domain S-box protein, partial [Gammaproteobacteria bacterium]|nr:PAS domain S-box protein [Gammaproteobacteria bacterium]NIR92605.1 PAS domain S-box protein [Gammaproteobacteria bacterium]NIW38932.1 PAS domain S-box protein [candidate division Zixibacteria bacterium]NIX55987.1 PAS domain S-box protein [candidate division Zixibacteria bacterium]